LHRPPARLGQYLAVFSYALIVLVWAVLGYDLWALYQERQRSAQEQVTQLVRALEVQVEQTVQAVDIALNSLAASIRRLPASERQISEVIEHLLAERGTGYGTTLEFLYVDGEGRGIASSQPGLTIGRNYADREYVKAHAGAPIGLFVGGPLQGRAFGKRFFPLSRALTDADGRRIGVIMASLEAELFNEVFSRFNLGPHAAIALMHASGKVIARHPDFEKHFAQDVAQSRLFSELLPKAAEGDYEVATATDGVSRHIHYKRVGQTPLIMAVGFARDDIWAAMHKDAAFRAAVGLVFSILVLLGLASLRRSQRIGDQASLQLQASEERYHGLYDTMSDGIVLRSPEGVVLDCNKAFCTMLGYAKADILGRNSREFTVPGNEAAEAEAYRQIESRGHSDEFEKAYLRADGQQLWTRIRAWKLGGDHGKPLLYWGVVRDVTAQRQAQEQLELSRKIIRHTSEAMLVTDAAERILTVNPAFERITGYSADEVIGKTPRTLSSGRHTKEFYQAMWATLNETGQWSGEIWDRRKNGEIYPKFLTINAIREGEQLQLSHYVAVFVDITDRKAQEERIEFLAHHDPLTGLPNRAALEVYLEGALSMARRHGTELAVMFIDLDNFKTINDSLGHHAGDQLLCEVARRLRDSSRESDRVARLGGDEFVVILEGIKRGEDVAGVAQKYLQAINQPYAIDQHELHTSPSIGISLYPSDGADAEALMRNADTAMYYAKSNGRNNFQFFAESMNLAANKRLHLESELWRALGENQLMLHYQPQVDLLTGKIVGVEALIRWNHPERGLIPPADFIPIAEETGLILPIGHWVLLTACRQAKAWLDAGSDMGDMAVNISAHQFRQPEFAQSVRNVLEETGLPPERLELEITESTVMNSADDSVHMLAELKGMGVKLAIDDFGTGYSSLAYLRRFPIDRLKIDRTFVTDMENDADAASLVASIIALGRSLGLRLVAEGVENSAQADLLRDKECERVQGYHYFRPGSAESILASMQEQTPESLQ